MVLKTSPITHPNVFSIDEHLQQVQSVSVSERVRGRERLKKQKGGRGSEGEYAHMQLDVLH